MVANHSALPGSVPIMLCSNASRAPPASSASRATTGGGWEEARGGEEGVGGGGVGGGRRGSRGGGLPADGGATAEQGDHRLFRGDRARHTAEALVVFDRLDVEQRRADLRTIAQPAEIILDAEMHGIADRDHRGEGQRPGICLVDG